MSPKSKTAGQHPAVSPQYVCSVAIYWHYSMAFLCLSRKVHSYNNKRLPC